MVPIDDLQLQAHARMVAPLVTLHLLHKPVLHGQRCLPRVWPVPLLVLYVLLGSSSLARPAPRFVVPRATSLRGPSPFNANLTSGPICDRGTANFWAQTAWVEVMAPAPWIGHSNTAEQHRDLSGSHPNHKGSTAAPAPPGLIVGPRRLVASQLLTAYANVCARDEGGAPAKVHVVPPSWLLTIPADVSIGDIFHTVMLPRVRNGTVDERWTSHMENTYLSLRAAVLRTSPKLVILHVTEMPTYRSVWWRLCLRLVTHIVEWRDTAMSVAGVDSVVQHRADYVRVQAILAAGGVCMDTDVITVGGFHAASRLLGKPASSISVALGLGGGAKGYICNAVIMARRGAPVLQRWLDNYLNNFHEESWGYNSGRVPYLLVNKKSVFGGAFFLAEHAMFGVPFSRWGSLRWPLLPPPKPALPPLPPLPNLQDVVAVHSWNVASKGWANAAKHHILCSELNSTYCQLLFPLMPHPFVAISTPDTSSARLADSLELQTFPLWQLTTSTSCTGDDVVAVWCLELLPDDVLPPHYLDALVNHLITLTMYEPPTCASGALRAALPPAGTNVYDIGTSCFAAEQPISPQLPVSQGRLVRYVLREQLIKTERTKLPME